MRTRPKAAAAAPVDTATERVYRGIYHAVVERRLAPGEWLREEELAAAFGVSRTVVRQALQRLAQDQVVALQHHRGARVAEPTLAEAAHVFEARRVVECEIAKRLGGRLTPAQLAELRALVQAEANADARGDTAEAVRASGEFHRAMARMHGNPVFVRLLDALIPTTSLLMARFKVGGGPVCVAHRHAEMVDALARDGPAAGAEMRRHLLELERSLTRPAAAVARSGATLRDLFAAYREPPDPDG
ncbi:GntR family transcriptional regulator [Calidifontimicrobium sp. SYSU G02091]|uniref:GntR family transcriptional regulator n=1 Tax=Calidifontimicrobium sp. SYSU G02091 TaxID=2926421 RepID=UPI001F530875|nr:GntR family transcriptional regulator [Calidifontimicrobium sp. SYSU G02091]MCI1191283.1 GntR family transcriptional regulator [Calidifontimicrobium sp. SYSU G02091]